MADELSIESGNDTVRNKIVFVGDVFVGKTTVMSRFTENNYKENYDVYIKLSSLLWESTFSQKRFITKGSVSFYRYGTLLDKRNIKVLSLVMWEELRLYSSFMMFLVKIKVILEKETFTNIGAWINFIKSVKVDNTMIVLCGNKIDLERLFIIWI